MEEWCSAKIKDMYLFRSQPHTQSIFSLVLSISGAFRSFSTAI